jgi:putative transposase
VPGHPEQNGAHERMHRTLKAETERPPEQTMERQQHLDEIRRVYNDERQHEALGQKPLATIYRPSPRAYPETLPPIQYAGHLEVRKSSTTGADAPRNRPLHALKIERRPGKRQRM